jgi:hypothetical protein
MIWAICYLIWKKRFFFRSLSFSPATYLASVIHSSVLELTLELNMKIEAVSNAHCRSGTYEDGRRLVEAHAILPHILHAKALVIHPVQFEEILLSMPSSKLTTLSIRILPNHSLVTPIDRLFFTSFFVAHRRLVYLELQASRLDQSYLNFCSVSCVNSTIETLSIIETNPWHNVDKVSTVIALLRALSGTLEATLHNREEYIATHFPNREESAIDPSELLSAPRNTIKIIKLALREKSRTLIHAEEHAELLEKVQSFCTLSISPHEAVN